ncbi:hypothetical protein ASE63_23500 [Bosea sp. Root381]|uniref:ABC transporter permease subunit n=1 Tax=Bosea sp. Root381 TaxID=1736524 RepID=UPI0007161F4D|nr:ABC transporter permease subunit [Bosea sp. Root381]KRE06922.1 hypothetical protein ASE63_23500 [Bosea sp. Root381]
MSSFAGWKGGPRAALTGFYGLAFLAGLGLVLWLAALVSGMQASQGIRGGFGFLSEPAGFQIPEALFPVGPSDSYLLVILAGLGNTLLVAALAIPLAVALGTAVALLRLFGSRPLAWLATAYVELFRNTPVLLQLFLWYGLLLLLPPIRQAFDPLPGVLISNRGLIVPALAQGGAWLALTAATVLALLLLRKRVTEGQRFWLSALAILPLAALAILPRPELEFGALRGLAVSGGWSLSPELAALTLGLILFHGAYIAEVVRAAILAVPMGQVEAARSLGLANGAIARLVVAPGAGRIALPPLANQFLALIKNSSLAVAIGYPDLVAVINTAINQTGQAIEGSALALGIYLALGLCVAGAVNLYHRRSSYGALTADPTERLGERLARSPVTPATPLARGLSGFSYAVLALAGLWLAKWALWDAVWLGPAQLCADGAGACWAVLAEKRGLILFGTMPGQAHIRAVIGIGLLLAAVSLIAARGLPLAWRAALAVLLALVAPLLVQGQTFGLSPVPVTSWGGVFVTLLLAVFSIGLAIPLALPLAVARRAATPLLRVPATFVIEAIRGVPLVLLLFVTASLLPLILGGLAVEKMWLVLAALVLHGAATLAEVWRGALAAVPPGQAEGAASMGLTRWQGFRLVVWPQALRIALPPTVGTIIGAVKDTSLVLVIGVFDVLGAAKAALADTLWRPYALEVYLAVAAFYFAICFPLSAYAERMRSGSSFNR